MGTIIGNKRILQISLQLRRSTSAFAKMAESRPMASSPNLSAKPLLTDGPDLSSSQVEEEEPTNVTICGQNCSRGVELQAWTSTCALQTQRRKPSGRKS